MCRSTVQHSHFEAFLDMTGSEKIFGEPHSMGRQLKAAIRDATGGLTVSVGISGTKYVAKVASGHQKPDGLTVVTPDEAKTWLAAFPVSRLWGAGPKTQARLNSLGLRTIGEVAGADPKFLFAKLGKVGLHFHTLAHANDPRNVIGQRLSKSIGSEHTLDTDVSDTAAIKLHLRRSAETIARRLRAKNYVAFGVGVKLKTAAFRLITRQHRLSDPTDVAEQIYSVGANLLNCIDHPGPFRLVGMAAYDLARNDGSAQLELFNITSRQRRLEVAMDTLAERFGDNVLHRANHHGSLVRLAPTLDFLDD